MLSLRNDITNLKNMPYNLPLFSLPSCESRTWSEAGRLLTRLMRGVFSALSSCQLLAQHRASKCR